MITREDLEKRIAEAFVGFQRGKSKEAMIALLANDIEKAINDAVVEAKNKPDELKNEKQEFRPQG
jgi:D-aminopeptidase